MIVDEARGRFVLFHEESLELGITSLEAQEDSIVYWPVDNSGCLASMVDRARMRLYQRGEATGAVVSAEHWRTLDRIEEALYSRNLPALGSTGCVGAEVSVS